jgi:hypothetical protein
MKARIEQTSGQDVRSFVAACRRDGLHARLGSLGEHLFASLSERLRSTVEAVHQRQTDFLVDGLRVDVKTTARDWASGLSELRPWSGPRAVGVSYALVELHPGGARISLEGALVGVLEWDAIEPMFREWSEYRGTQRSPSTLKAANLRAWAEIQEELEAFFGRHGMRCKAIYRTNQKSWGKESPANLKLRRWPKDVVRVLVSFSGVVDRGAVEYVLAIRAEDEGSLPMLGADEVALHKPKVDIERLPRRLVFADLADLFHRWDR